MAIRGPDLLPGGRSKGPNTIFCVVVLISAQFRGPEAEIPFLGHFWGATIFGLGGTPPLAKLFFSARPPTLRRGFTRFSQFGAEFDENRVFGPFFDPSDPIFSILGIASLSWQGSGEWTMIPYLMRGRETSNSLAPHFRPCWPWFWIFARFGYTILARQDTGFFQEPLFFHKCYNENGST